MTLAALLPPELLLAQQRQHYNYKLTEPDQELDGFSGGYAKIHKLSAQLRGVRGANGTIYWVSVDGSRLSAYQNNKLLWQTNVAKPFQAVIHQAKVTSLIFTFNIIFVRVSELERFPG